MEIKENKIVGNTFYPLSLVYFFYKLSETKIHATICQETPEFDLQFEKTYKWVASSPAEKFNFITGLYKVITKCYFSSATVSILLLFSAWAVNWKGCMRTTYNIYINYICNNISLFYTKLCERYPTQRKPTIYNINTALIEGKVESFSMLQ